MFTCRRKASLVNFKYLFLKEVDFMTEVEDFTNSLYCSQTARE